MGNGRKMKRAMDAKAIDRGELVAEIKRLGAENLRRRKDNERLARELAESQMALGASLDLLNALTWMEGRLSANAEDDFIVHVPAAEGEDVYHGKTPAEAIVAAWAEYVRQGKEARTKIRAYAEEHGLPGDADPAPAPIVGLPFIHAEPDVGDSPEADDLCERCGGSGSISRAVDDAGYQIPDCPACRGTGNATFEPEAVPCDECAEFDDCVHGVRERGKACPPVKPPPSDDVGPGLCEPPIPAAPETMCLGDEDEAEVQP